jgi:hypothetical protein
VMESHYPRVTSMRTGSGIQIDPWASIAWLLPAAAVLFSSMPVGDLAYIVRSGQLMEQSGSLLRHDVFTFSMAGQPWLNQQWGAELILGALFRPLQWRGLCLVRAALVSFAAGTTYTRTRREDGAPLVAGCLTLGALIVAITLPGALALRPQLLAVPLFVAATWLIHQRESYPDRLFALPVIGIIWANVHGSFFLLPLLLVIAALDDLVARRRTLKRTACLAVVTLATPLVSPWGIGTYRYVAQLATSPIVRDVVDEWKPLVTQFPAWLLFASAMIAGALVILRRGSRRPSVEESVTLVVFTLLAIWSGRNLIWWLLTVPPVVGALLAGWAPGGRFSLRASMVISIALVLLVLIGVIRVASLEPQEALLSEAPVGVTKALRTSASPGARVFDGRWGSWFEFSVTSTQMFVDSRAEFFPIGVWDDYFHVSNAEPGWQQVLDRWDVGVVVAAKDHDAALIQAIRSDQDWRLIYEDADGAVFVRA